MSDYDYDSESSDYDYIDDVDNEEDIQPVQDYEVVDIELLQRQQIETIGEMADMLQVSKDTAIVLLRSNRWSKDCVQEKYYGVESPEQYLASCGASCIDKLQIGFSICQLNCVVCGENVPGSEMADLGCGHRYCLNCWAGYLQAKLDDGPISLTTRCMAYKCPNLIPHTLFQYVLEKKYIETYLKWHLRSFIDLNPFIKWCPAPQCHRAVRGNGGMYFVPCECGFEFCLRCGEESHPVISCDIQKKWNERCSSESETVHWMVVNTKQCPKCCVRIEKNHGCNHMTCKSCHHEFCWICMSNWKTHGGDAYRCNSFKTSENDIKTAKTELERYLHYNVRFFNHMKSEVICIGIRNEYGTSIQDHVDEQHLIRALDLLVKCRHTLKYTYAFGYYMEPRTKSEKDLFEFLQANLEANVEHLTGLTEKSTSDIDIAEIMNYTTVTANFLVRFLDGIENGLCTE